LANQEEKKSSENGSVVTKTENKEQETSGKQKSKTIPQKEEPKKTRTK